MSSTRPSTFGSLTLVLVFAAAWAGCTDGGDAVSIADPSRQTPRYFAAAALPSYEVKVIPAPAAVAWRVNESGDVVGWTKGTAQPYLYTAEDGVVVLPLLAGMSSGVARDLMERSGGEVVVVGEGVGRALRWRVAVPGGTVLEVTELAPGVVQSEARGVNGAGEIVGVKDYNRAFFFTDATGIVDLGIGGLGSPAYAHDINDAGVAAGYAGNVAFRWTRAGGVEFLGVPADFAFSFGFSINEARQVSGAVTNATGNRERLARYTDGVGWEILGGIGDTNLGWGINNRGDVVGEGRADSGPTFMKKGVIYTDELGMVRYVDDFQIDPAPEWRVLYANDINDARQIVGIATNTVVGGGAAVLINPVGSPPPPVDEPDIAVSPASLDFGAVAVGATADRVVSVANVGTSDLEVTGLGTTNGVFSVVSPAAPFTVTPGSAQDVTVRFSPSAAGPATGSLQIESDDPDEGSLSVLLAGEGFEPVPGVFRINVGGASYTAAGGNVFVADRAFVPGGFGYVGGHAAVFTGNVSGTTDDPLYLSMRGAAFFEYRFDGLASGFYRVTLFFTEPVSNRTVGQRVFDVTAEGVLVLDDLDLVAAAGAARAAHQETFTVSVTDGTLDLGFTAVVDGNAIVSAIEVVSDAGTPGEPDIAVSPASLDFGAVAVGATADRVVSVSNAGTADLEVTGLATTNGVFSVVTPAAPFTVTPGSAQDVTVRFSPSAAGAATGSLQIESDDPDEGLLAVPLAGEGTESGPGVFRINVGGADFTAAGGNLFVADRAFVPGGFGYVGGHAAVFTGNVSGTTDDPLYLSMRGAAFFEYRFDGLASGFYRVTLFFTEPVSNRTVGQRVFDVTAEGVLVLDDLDLVAAAGAARAAHQETFTVSVTDGTLDLGFTAVVGGNAIVSAIEIVRQQ